MTEATPAAELEYMYGLERFGIRLGLEVMNQLMTALGHPEQAWRSIHITGTNGKGSTASFLESSLRQTSLKVGLYTSPHLYTFNERVRVNGQSIADADLIRLVARIRRIIEAEKLTVTFFEFTTALAFLYFAEQQVDLAIIEVGMGGTLDATNVITPLISVITNVGLDHVPILGTSKDDIARNKAGIIKSGGIVVTAEKNLELLQVFKDVAGEQRATLYQVQRELSVTDIQSSLQGQTFAVDGRYHGLISITLLGQHQIENALTAILTLRILPELGVAITQQEIQRGLQQATWEGRLDIVSDNPFVLVDGAHNADGVAALQQFLETMSLPPPDVLIFALKKGKDVGEIAQYIVPLFREVIVTEGTYEPESAERIAAALRTKIPVTIVPEPAQAVAMGLKKLRPKRMLLITGSLYMIGDALTALREQLDSRG
ncbi:MAG: folylpolyglutamate synthase/dihydrofolate synthase family protein [Candidatus Andersenbacteria bacterium]